MKKKPAPSSDELDLLTRRDMIKVSGSAVAGAAVGHMVPEGLVQESGDLTQYVDPFIGTGAHGHTFPGPQLPFGAVQLSPDNGTSGWDWSSGYHWSSDRIAGFSHTHLSGTGIGDMCDILLMPTFAMNPPLPDVSSHFEHDDESASPGYYSALLKTTGIRAELTTSERAGFHRYHFPSSPPGHHPTLAVDLVHSLNGDRPTDAHIQIKTPTLLVGYRHSTGWADDQRVYFAMRLSQPFREHWMEAADSSVSRVQEVRGLQLKAGLQFSQDVTRLLVKVGISGVSTQSALANLDQDIPGWDFEETRSRAESIWDIVLGRIRVQGATHEQKTILYTSLYHACLAPQLFSDVDGRYRGADGSVHKGSHQNYSVFSLWDTFRAAHPLLTLIQPERVDALVQSMMSFYRERGYLPVWSLAGNETDTMIGYHSVPVLLDAIEKELTRVDPKEALDAMLKSAGQDGFGLRYLKAPRVYSRQEIEGAADSQGDIRIEKISAANPPSGPVVAGYQRTLSGATFSYHSPFGERPALLLRTRKDSAPLEWETAPVPVGLPGGPTSFAWLVGFDAGQPRGEFTLDIDGSPRFSFRAPSEDGALAVKAHGRGELTFQRTHSDQFGDVFGFMFLTLETRLSAGQRLHFRVTAQDTGSNQWYMTFQHELRDRAKATYFHGLLEEHDQQKQPILVGVENAGTAGPGQIMVGEETIEARFEYGDNRFVVAVPPLARETTIPVRARMAGRDFEGSDLNLRPPQPFDYLPADWEKESVSKTLEYAYDDWCISRLASQLGELETAAEFARRAGFYRNVFDPETRFMRGRLSDGSWRTPFSARFSQHRNDDYTEGNAWQYSWFVPHDVDGLIELMGGRESFIEKLDALFEQSSTIEGSNASPDISGLIGQYAHGNEPSQHIAYLYCFAAAPWKTQERVRQITDTLYNMTPGGLPGNEDCGQMSAWFVLSSIGFYPLNPANGIYVIGTPHYDRVSIDVEGGKTFTIEAAGTSSLNKYIQSAELNGRELTSCFLRHVDIVEGGTLRFVMGASPKTTWGVNPLASAQGER